jgi:alpha-L-arabinofuranosidase
MASANHRDILVAGKTDDAEVTVSATRDREGASVVLHLCNSSAAAKSVALDFAGAPGLKLAKATSLSAPRLEDRNPPDDPDRISPKDVTAAFSSSPSVKPFSYTVLEFRK